MNDASRNLYAILGVAPEATADDIREAYRVMARRFHPDANRNSGAEVQFRDIATAYSVLSDPGERLRYDDARRHFSDEPAYFSLRAIPSKRVLGTLVEPQVLYLLLDIVPTQRAVANRRSTAPMNLTLVLDRSTSMRGARLDKVKVAAHHIIDQLSPQDVLAVVSFSDRADVLIPATAVTDKTSLRSTVSVMRAEGGTEIYRGLAAGVAECRKYLAPRMVNHVILLTDGRTFGDEERCLAVARQAAEDGIGISAMGIGEEWNDEFLDALATNTGGSSAYINTPRAVLQFLDDRVRSLGDAFAERLQLAVAPDADVVLESVFRLNPHPQPLEAKQQPIPLGTLEKNRPIRVLIQLQMPPSSKAGFRSVVRLDATGDVLVAERHQYKVISDIAIELAHEPSPEQPPTAILDALGKLTLYRIQQKAERALTQGLPLEAARQLENLATRLFAAGQDELAHKAIHEARRVSRTQAFSQEGRKSLKFHTRQLLALPAPGNDTP
ncbi:MAG: VWA domain-containing protein [Anaerolineae bacterium]|nr:VWA domain-containing protein [Anaerolineae bacterium]